jgi:hypothetical protein
MQRVKISGITQRHLIQADLVLFIRDAFESIRNEGPQKWWPGTLIYLERSAEPPEIFARAQSAEYFNKLKYVFDIQSKGDFESLLESFDNKKLRRFKMILSLSTPEMSNLIGFERMATLP